MPNRILKESICFSPEIEQLSWFEEVVFYRLLTIVDDLGHMDGRDIVLVHSLFPTREDVSKQQVAKAISRLEEVGLINRYTVDGRPYITITTWHEHQKLRRYKQKYPLPLDYIPPVAVDKITFLDGNLPTTNGNLPTTNGKMPSSNGQLTAKCRQRTAETETENEVDLEYDQEHEVDAATSSPSSCESGTERPSFDTIQVYASNCLRALTPGNMEALNAYVEEMGEELVRYALDAACAQGVANWRYAEKILIRLREQGIRTVGDAKAADEDFRRHKSLTADNLDAGRDDWT